MRVLAFALLLAPSVAFAQIRASELGSVSQTIDGTKITIDYSRPRARGRDTLFTKFDMKWGFVWTPGANWATTIDVDHDVKLDGHPVPKGKYSMWFVLTGPKEWTLLLDPKARRFHEDRPDTTKIALRFSVHPQPVPFTDVLTWSFPAFRMSGTTLEMAWERLKVDIDVEVQPSLVMTVPTADATPYLGEYTWSDVDSTGKVTKTYAFTVSHENGTLKGQWTPDDPYFRKFALVRIGPDWFAPGVYDKSGELYEILKPDLVIEFKRENGRATSLVMRDEDDHVVSTGTRKPRAP